nr:hypothetical protein [Angustibacter aerolatus]
MTETAQTTEATEAPAHEVLLTDVASAKVKSLLEQEGRDDLRLRIGVQPGGCSGLIYQAVLRRALARRRPGAGLRRRRAWSSTA